MTYYPEADHGQPNARQEHDDYAAEMAEAAAFEAYLDSEAGLPFNGDADATRVMEYSPALQAEVEADDMRCGW